MNKTALKHRAKKENHCEFIGEELVELNEKYSHVYYECREQLENFSCKYKYYSNPKTVLHRFDNSYLMPKLSELSVAIKEFQIYQETFILIYEKIWKACYSIDKKNITNARNLTEELFFINNEVLSYEELAYKLEEKTKYILKIFEELDFFDNGMQFLQHKFRRLEDLEAEIFYPENDSIHENLREEYDEVYSLGIANRQALFNKEKPFIFSKISNLTDSRKFHDAGDILYDFIHKFSVTRFLMAEKRIKPQRCNEQGEFFMFENLAKELENITIKKQQKNILEKYRLKNQYFVYCQSEPLWKIIINNSETLNYTNEFLEDYELETIPDLRTAYPELAGINDASLYGLYDSYQASCNLVNGWDVEREEVFLFYLICDLANFEIQDPDDLFFGEIMAYFLLQDKSLESAKVLAVQIKEFYTSYKIYFY